LGEYGLNPATRALANKPGPLTERNEMLSKLIFALALVALMTGATLPGGGNVSAARQARTKSASKKTTRYACPMHPEVVAGKPGKCPKCGMTLRLVKEETDGVTEPANATAPASDTPKPSADDNAHLSPPKIPDINVYDQDGKQLKFYTDLVKGKVVAINFIFTTCTTICPPLTATFRRVQQELEKGTGRDVRLISISVDPMVDTPERLRDFAAKFKAQPGWTFVTGDKIEIDSLLRALGAAVTDKNDHTPIVLVGNDATGYWTRTYGLSPPLALVKVITETADHK
jgi:cytochrome oxidase Cu insertion factor (SCO1/SenC/PrrC family)